MPETPTCEFDIRVTPRSSKNKVELVEGGTLKIWVTAAPTDGQANDAVIEVLAKQLRIAKSHIDIVRGHTSRDKRVRIEGLCTEEVEQKMEQGKLF